MYIILYIILLFINYMYICMYIHIIHKISKKHYTVWVMQIQIWKMPHGDFGENFRFCKQIIYSRFLN